MGILRDTRFDFLGKRYWTYLFSFVVIVVGLSVFASRGQKNFGPDFTGGDLLQIEFSSPRSAAEVAKAVEKTTVATVQSLGTEGKEFLIRSGPGTSPAVLQNLYEIYGKDSLTIKTNTSIEPSMSFSLRKKALQAFIWGMVGILLYLTVRFEFRLAVGATLAIIHDICFCLAVMALARQQIDTPVVAAFLTVAGYSVNDTVII
ncbi:MAG: hypothetical protein NC911_02300, partial [Candidatus Omnitrophica bacterium]|nr:hypothetical protein [Candidatus Omnitrophota bacterium]